MERKKFCSFLKSFKLSSGYGYAAHISRNISVKDGKIFGLNSHDCHAMLQRLIPIDIQVCLADKKVCDA